MLGRGTLRPARSPAPLRPPARLPGLQHRRFAVAPRSGREVRHQPGSAAPQGRARRLPPRDSPAPEGGTSGPALGAEWAASRRRWRRLAVAGTQGRAGRTPRPAVRSPQPRRRPPPSPFAPRSDRSSERGRWQRDGQKYAVGWAAGPGAPPGSGLGPQEPGPPP